MAYDARPRCSGRTLLLGAAVLGAAVFSTSGARAADDLRAGDAFVGGGIGVGTLSYNQTVDGGGFFIGGTGYQLKYSGTPVSFIANGGYYLHPNWAIGAELAYTTTFGLTASGMSTDGTKRADLSDIPTGKSGRLGALLAFRPIRPLRFDVTAGYGGGGTDGIWGGAGPAFTLAGQYLIYLPSTAIGLGLRGEAMALSHGSSTTYGSGVTITGRAESGPLLAGFVTLSFSWVRFN